MKTHALAAFGLALLVNLGGMTVVARATTRPTTGPATTAPATQPLVTYLPGDVPILLTVPHDGADAVPDAPVRAGGKDVRGFVVLRDVNTRALAEQLAGAVERELGGRPYVVIARFHRKYADANRPATDAYEHENVRPHYEAFHGAIETAAEDIRARWGRGLLLDIHGQVAEPDGIYRGTRNGKTTRALLDRFGDAALVGPDSVFGHLAAQGYQILPTVPPDGLGRETKFNGGHIVDRHGSHQGTAIDAIQMEFGSNLRKNAQLEQTANDAAKAVAAFARKYLPATRDDSGADAAPVTE